MTIQSEFSMNTQEFQKFNDNIRDFIAYLAHEKNVSSHTQRAYKSDMRQLSQFWDKLIERTRTEEQKHTSYQPTLSFKEIIDRYINWLHHKAIDNYSIARKISCLNSYERFIAAREQRVPQMQLSRPLLEKKALPIIAYDDITQLLDSTSSSSLPSNFPQRDRAILEILYATGIRCSELVALQLANVDTARQRLHITDNGKKERFITLSERCTSRLSEYLQHERIAPQSDQESLFFNYRNQPLTTRSIQRICENFRGLLRIPYPITPHILRSSRATHLIEQGASLGEVQEMLGYSTRISAEKYLAHAVQQRASAIK
jgi:Site-specific recombinase XerD